jgi:hypothetical protein
MERNITYHSKRKHIDFQYHFVRDMVEDNKVLLVKVDTLKNISYLLANSASIRKCSWCREAMDIASLNC